MVVHGYTLFSKQAKKSYLQDLTLEHSQGVNPPDRTMMVYRKQEEMLFSERAIGECGQF